MSQVAWSAGCSCACGRAKDFSHRIWEEKGGVGVSGLVRRHQRHGFWRERFSFLKRLTEGLQRCCVALPCRRTVCGNAPSQNHLVRRSENKQPLVVIAIRQERFHGTILQRPSASFRAAVTLAGRQPRHPCAMGAVIKIFAVEGLGQIQAHCCCPGFKIVPHCFLLHGFSCQVRCSRGCLSPRQRCDAAVIVAAMLSALAFPCAALLRRTGRLWFELTAKKDFLILTVPQTGWNPLCSQTS